MKRQQPTAKPGAKKTATKKHAVKPAAEDQCTKKPTIAEKKTTRQAIIKEQLAPKKEGALDFISYYFFKSREVSFLIDRICFIEKSLKKAKVLKYSSPDLPFNNRTFEFFEALDNMYTQPTLENEEELDRLFGPKKINKAAQEKAAQEEADQAMNKVIQTLRDTNNFSKALYIVLSQKGVSPEKIHNLDDDCHYDLLCEIMDLTVESENFTEKAKGYCAGLTTMYMALANACIYSHSEQWRTIKTIHITERVAALLNQKVFEYIGYQNRQFLASKASSTAGSKESAARQKLKQDIRNRIFHDKIRDEYFLAKEMLLNFANSYIRDSTTVKKIVREIQKEEGIIVKGDWVKGRRNKKQKA